MPNLVIVALPSEDDYVNKISSEKVAHMTLLFLGEVSKVSNLTKILDFTDFASNLMLNRFYMEVDRRGELGPDSADVLFFKKSKWTDFNSIDSFRSALLKNNNIRTAYDSVEQFDGEWIPHLTLGYPTNPAKPDNRDYPGIYSVNFDRIAVWTEDFAGIEFPLKSYDSEIMSDIGKTFVDTIFHISEKPWSDYTEADYTLKQWHNACLIHQHVGPPTSKSQCKLPVKTPGGVLNRNGVHAALAALHDARTPLKASADEKAKAAVALRRYYNQLGETIPESLAQSAMTIREVINNALAQKVISNVLKHHGDTNLSPLEQ